MNTEKVNILSVDISRLNLLQTLQSFSETIINNEKKRYCVTPVNCVLWARKNENLQKVYNTSDLNLADGVPLIWASKLFGKPIQGRVTGLDVLPKFSEIAAKNKFTFFFLGAAEGVAEKLKIVLTQQFPNLQIVGVYSPPFADKFSDEENQKIITMINAVKPDVLWVSLTAPKQDFWIYEHFEKLDIHIAIGVGGAFEVVAGLIKRAPKWMQNSGLEWFYRFLNEPIRLFRRYFIEAPIFIPLIILQSIGVLKYKQRQD